MATAPLTFGDRLTAAGLTWEVSDARSHEPGPTLGEPRADLCPINPDSGERISNVRIGRAERPYVRVNIRAGRSGDLELYPSSGYGTPLTDRQREIILADLAGYRFELPPLTVPEIIERITHDISTRSAHKASEALHYSTRTALRDALAALPAGESSAYRAAVIDAACAAFRERMARDVGQM